MRAMNLKTDESANSQANIIALGNFEPVLAALDAGELLQAAMIDLNLPGIQGIKGGLLNGHVQSTGSPVFRVAVRADSLEDFNPAVTLEMNNGLASGWKSG